MTLPSHAKAAIFHGTGQPMELRDVPLPESPEPGETIVRVNLATICGSDLHTIDGRRTEPAPLILGHEIVGEVAAVGDAVEEHAPGERVTWSIATRCDTCFFCDHDLPQKCGQARKYGHTTLADFGGLTGGYAEYVRLMPHSAVYRVPDALDDREAAPANCALATVIHLLEATGGVSVGDCAVVQGAGMLGLYLVALLIERGAGSVIVADVREDRLQLATRFGADHTFDLSRQAPEVLMRRVRELTGDRGADVVFETSGQPSVVSWGLDALRIGGRYGHAGMVAPSEFTLDGNVLTRKELTLRGIHNYAPRHLEEGLRFLEETRARFPYRDLVGEVYPLAEIESAIEAARSGTSPRIGVRP